MLIKVGPVVGYDDGDVGELDAEELRVMIWVTEWEAGVITSNVLLIILSLNTNTSWWCLYKARGPGQYPGYHIKFIISH